MSHFPCDHLEDAVEIFVDVWIEEPQNLDAKGLDKLAAPFVMLSSAILKMTLTIELNSYSRFRRIEVQNIRSNTVLPPESASEQLPTL